MYADRPPIETRDRHGFAPIEFREEVPHERICSRTPVEEDWSYCEWPGESEAATSLMPTSATICSAAHIGFTYNLAVTTQEFYELSEQWKRETSFHSSLAKKFTHPAYQTIMAMGRDALPLILQSLETEPDHWFYALKFIARNDVGEGAESFESARLKWLEWGKENGYL